MSEAPADTHATPGPARTIDWPIVAFFVLAYAIAWGTFLILGNIARRSGMDDSVAFLELAEALNFEGLSLVIPGWLVYLLTRVQDFAFSIAGLIMIAATAGRPGLRRLGRRLVQWRIGWRWYLAGLIPLALYALAVLVAGLGDEAVLGTADFSLSSLSAILFSAQAGLLVSLFLRGAMGEELGLRGFALPRLQERRGPFAASLIIGLLWAGWHLPVLLGRDVFSVIVFVLLATTLSFVFTWLFNGAGGSLIPVLLFHATQNAEEMFEVLFPALAGTDWELVSTLVLLLLSLVIVMVIWRRRSDPVKLAQ